MHSKRVASSVYLIDATTGSELARLPGGKLCTFHPSEDRLLTANRVTLEGIVVFDLILTSRRADKLEPAMTRTISVPTNEYRRAPRFSPPSTPSDR